MRWYSLIVSYEASWEVLVSNIFHLKQEVFIKSDTYQDQSATSKKWGASLLSGKIDYQ